MHIGVAGNIGCGKTTLTRMLAEYYKWTPRYEAVTYNPYLEDYYSDISRWSFNLEVYFLAQRFKDVLDIAKSQDVIIQDRTIMEGVEIFVANNHKLGNLTDRDFETYMEKSLREYLLAMEKESEPAAQRLLFHWNREFNSSQYTEEEKAVAQANYRDMIEDYLAPEIERLKEQDDEKACCALGQMYFYGIIFEQNLLKAREYFQRLADAGYSFGQRMLTNPLFDEDDEDE